MFDRGLKINLRFYISIECPETQYGELIVPINKIELKRFLQKLEKGVDRKSAMSYLLSIAKRHSGL